MSNKEVIGNNSSSNRGVKQRKSKTRGGQRVDWREEEIKRGLAIVTTTKSLNS
jgi:hypothetical protein